MSTSLLLILGLSLISVVLSTPVQHHGYIKVNEKENGHLFYWLVESASNPTVDPVVLWMSGGPGCSGGLALFMENGPWTVDANLTLIDNPYSWHKAATVIWIDQPVNVGYSYAYNNYVVDEASDMRAFLKGFFAKHPKYASQDFYISGESYGGKYVPTVANMILQENAKGNFKIPLKGISVGNGIIAPVYQYPLQGEAAHLAGLLDQKSYEAIKQQEAKCEALLKASQWAEANKVCNQIMIDILHAAGDINPMNYKQHCKIQDCFVYTNITKYLNQASTKNRLGVPSNITWQTCSFDIQFTDKDQMDSFAWEYTNLLNAGINVLIYYGDLDLVCPANGGLNWATNTPWIGQSGFKRAQLSNWVLNGKVVGEWKQFRNFQFVIVHDAGHMTPTDQPAVSLELFSNFLYHVPFGKQQN